MGPRHGWVQSMRGVQRDGWTRQKVSLKEITPEVTSGRVSANQTGVGGEGASYRVRHVKADGHWFGTLNKRGNSCVALGEGK